MQLTASSDTKTLPELVEAIAEDDMKNGSKLVQARKEGSR